MARSSCKSDGWDAPAILEKTLAVSLKLRDGTIAFQQDTITYNRVIYSEPILAFIAMTAAMGRGKLNVIDFGGSLGTNFFQNKRVLQKFIDRGHCLWNVVERPATAELGRKHFEDPNLRFFSSFAELRANVAEYPEALLFSGSFQYVSDPNALLHQAMGYGAKLVAFDRLLVSPNDQHEIYVQRPDPKICYAATYPVWCFSRAVFMKDMTSIGFVRVVGLHEDAGLEV